MKVSRSVLVVFSAGSCFLILALISMAVIGKSPAPRLATSTSTSTSVMSHTSTSDPVAPQQAATFQSNFSVALSAYQHWKSYESDQQLIHRLGSKLDPSRTWAAIELSGSGLDPATGYMHLVGHKVVWFAPSTPIIQSCPAPEAICRSLFQSNAVQSVVNHVGNVVVLQQPLDVSITVVYRVWDASCSQVGNLEGTFFRDPQFGDEYGWDNTSNPIDGQAQTDQGDTVPTCSYVISGTLDYLPSKSVPLTVCIRTSNGYLPGSAKFVQSISKTRLQYYDVNFDVIDGGQLGFLQTCAGESI